MDHEATPPIRWRIPAWGWVLIVIGLLLLLLVGTWAGWRVKLEGQVREQVERIRAAGYPMTGPELDAWYPHPQGENAADALELAFQQYREPELAGDIRDLPIFGRGELPSPSSPLPDETREGLLAIVALNQDAIEQLHRAAAIPEARFPIDLGQGYYMELPHLSQLREGAKLLQADALLAIEAGDGDRAWRNVMSMLQLSRTLREEPILISMLVAISIRDMSFETIQHILSRSNSVREAINAAAELWPEFAHRRYFVRAVAGERASAWELIDLASDGVVAPESGMPASSNRRDRAMEMLGVRTLDRLLYLQLMERHISVLENEPLEGWRRAIEQLTDELWTEAPDYYDYYDLTRVLFPAMTAIAAAVIRDIACGRIIRLTAAVERHRRDHGRAPASLSELEAQGVEIPLDPFDGQPLRYRLLEHGYLIYSVDQDGVDGGGIPRQAAAGRPGEGDLLFRVERLPHDTATNHDDGQLP